VPGVGLHRKKREISQAMSHGTWIGDGGKVNRNRWHALQIPGNGQSPAKRNSLSRKIRGPLIAASGPEKASRETVRKGKLPTKSSEKLPLSVKHEGIRRKEVPNKGTAYNEESTQDTEKAPGELAKEKVRNDGDAFRKWGGWAARNIPKGPEDQARA